MIGRGLPVQSVSYENRRVGGQRVTHAGTFPTASLRTVLDRFRITRLSS